MRAGVPLSTVMMLPDSKMTSHDMDTIYVAWLIQWLWHDSFNKYDMTYSIKHHISKNGAVPSQKKKKTYNNGYEDVREKRDEA